jgi:hypothetical protein
VYCARLVSAASVIAKLMLCEKAFAPADAVTPRSPASRSGQHQLPTARRPALFRQLDAQDRVDNRLVLKHLNTQVLSTLPTLPGEWSTAHQSQPLALHDIEEKLQARNPGRPCFKVHIPAQQNTSGPFGLLKCIPFISCITYQKSNLVK